MVETPRELSAEVLVIGAGPAGLAAAVAAGEQGREVLVVDDNPQVGGQIWRASRQGLNAEAAALLRRAEQVGVRFAAGLTVFDAPRADLLHAVDVAGAAVRLRAPRLVLCAGSTELFLPFPGWTLPGVCGAGGLQALVKGGLDVRGKRVAVAGSGPLLIAVAAALLEAGAEVRGLYEQAPRGRMLGFGLELARHPTKLRQAARLTAALRKVPQRHAEWPIEALGDGRLERVVLRSARGFRRGQREREFEVDYLACSFGLVPRTRIAELLGCALDGHSARAAVWVDDNLRTSVDHVWCAGESTGIGGVEVALVEGQAAGLAAADRVDLVAGLRGRLRKERRFAAALDRAFELRDELRDLPRADTLVCRCEDVPLASIEGLVDSRQAKLETRCGMGACQGRVCGPALDFLRGLPRDRARPPLLPVPMGALAALGAGSDAATASPGTPETSR